MLRILHECERNVWQATFQVLVHGTMLNANLDNNLLGLIIFHGINSPPAKLYEHSNLSLKLTLHCSSAEILKYVLYF